MSQARISHLLHQKEGLRLEFKEAVSTLPENLFETVCAFLNRAGGDILLGVDDEGRVIGVNAIRVPQLLKEIANLSNNPQKLDPPFILLPQAVEWEGKQLIHLQVPQSSQVHKSKGVVYDRSEDGDYKLSNHTAIAELYTRKSASYSENTIYPYLRFSDFKPELFPKVRNLIRSRDYNHPWMALNDEQLLQKAGLYRRDVQSGQEGYTLAAALLLGQDETIQSVLPHYKTDALVRRQNLDRYDDRLYVQTNLIDAYDQLMGFLAKHLPDKFFLEGTIRISLRSKIFREVVANLLVHREFTNGHPARLIIYTNRVETENANRPHTYGYLVPENFSPFTKNPVIAKFFTQLGHVDELGSGILNVNKYLPFYAPGKVPLFQEGDIFKIVIPLEGAEAVSEGASDAVNRGVNEGATEWYPSHHKHLRQIVTQSLQEAVKSGKLEAVSEAVNEAINEAVNIIAAENKGVSLKALLEKTGKSRASMQRYIQTLKAVGIVEFKGAAKTGRYCLTEKALSKIQREGH